MQNIQTKDLSKKLQILPEYLIDLLRDIGKLADEKEVRVYIVGGFVRDMLIGISNFDIDLVIEGDAVAFSKSLKKIVNAKIKIFPKFKTAKLMLKNGLIVDLAMARTESYACPAALPVVESSSLIKDLYRRDFTINTLALSLNKKTFGLVIDYFKASEDIKQKKIKILHDLSFIDDPTRIFRAVRFEQRFDFRIEKHTLKLIFAAIDRKIFKKLSRFRMTNELILLLSEMSPLKVIRRMNALDKLDFMHSNIKLKSDLVGKIKNVEKTINWYKKYCPDKSFKQWLVYLMAIIDDLSMKGFNELFEVFSFSRNDKDVLLKTKKDGCRCLSRVYRLDDLLNNRSIEESLFLISKSKKTTIKKIFTDYLVRYDNINRDK